MAASIRFRKIVSKLPGALAAIAAICAVTLATSHSEEPSAPGWYKADDVRWQINHLAFLSGPTANCSASGSCQGAQAPSDACVSAYNRLYGDKDDLSFRVFIGYWDTQPEPGAPRTDAVIDGFVRSLFTEILTAPCADGLNACGFAHDEQAQDGTESVHLAKEITGPDGKPRTIHLSLESASVSASDDENRHELKKEQHAQTSQIQADFIASLGGADVVLYTGHSRWGTGPGFKSLPTLSWSWIDAGLFKPARRKMEKALSHASDKPAVVGIFSCTSEKYYSKALEKDAPETGLTLTTAVPSDMIAHEDTLGTLNALLGLQCEDDFKQSLPDAEILDFFGGQK